MRQKRYHCATTPCKKDTLLKYYTGKTKHTGAHNAIAPALQYDATHDQYAPMPNNPLRRIGEQAATGVPHVEAIHPTHESAPEETEGTMLNRMTRRKIIFFDSVAPL